MAESPLAPVPPSRESIHSDTVWAAYIGAVIAGFAALLATWHGPGLGPDSVNYLSAGLNLGAGEGLVTFNGETLTMFAPGFSSFIALFDRAGIDPEFGIRVLNALSAGASVWMGSLLLRRHVKSRALVVGATFFLAVSVALVAIAEMALTESVFVAVALGLLICLENVGVTKRPGLSVGLAVGIVWVAFLIRYTGIALIPIGALSILLGVKSAGLGKAVRWSVGFTFASAVVPIAWALRNHSVNGTLLGPRASSPDGIMITVQRFVATLGKWIVPEPVPLGVQAVLGAAFAGASVLAVIWLASSSRQRSLLRKGPMGYSLDSIVIFVGGYSGYLIAAQLVTAIDPLGTRLMAPLFVPMVVLAVVVGEAAVSALRSRAGGSAPDLSRAKAVGAVIAVALVAVLMIQSVLFVLQVWESGSGGVEYADREWTTSEFVEAGRSVPADASFYSNVPAGLWSVLRREPITRSPEQKARRSPDQVTMSQEFLEAVACTDAYLLWYDKGQGDYLFTPEELKSYVDLEVVKNPEDGTLYRLSSTADTFEC